MTLNVKFRDQTLLLTQRVSSVQPQIALSLSGCTKFNSTALPVCIIRHCHLQRRTRKRKCNVGTTRATTSRRRFSSRLRTTSRSVFRRKSCRTTSPSTSATRSRWRRRRRRRKRTSRCALTSTTGSAKISARSRRWSRRRRPGIYACFFSWNNSRHYEAGPASVGLLVQQLGCGIFMLWGHC